MAIERNYKCNLCGDRGSAFDFPRLIGLHFKSWPKGWEEKPAHQCENHICASCLSSLQGFTPRCGQGHECDGGPSCGSDHK